MLSSIRGGNFPPFPVGLFPPDLIYGLPYGRPFYFFFEMIHQRTSGMFIVPSAFINGRKLKFAGIIIVVVSPPPPGTDILTLKANLLFSKRRFTVAGSSISTFVISRSITFRPVPALSDVFVLSIICIEASCVAAACCFAAFSAAIVAAAFSGVHAASDLLSSGP